VTPQSLVLSHPVAISGWYQHLSFANPSLIYAMGAGWADVVRTAAVTGRPLTSTEKA
jgi:hypothetical protein